MIMQLRDVIQYYIGQSCVNDFFPEGHEMRDFSWVLTAYDRSSRKPYKLENEADYTWTADIKPILRRLSDMEEEEAKELVMLRADHLYGPHPTGRTYETYFNTFGQIVVSWGPGFKEKNVPQSKECFYPVEFHYLLQRGFDLWNPIDSGQAVDVKTIKQ